MISSVDNYDTNNNVQFRNNGQNNSSHNSARCTRNMLYSVSGIGTVVVGTANLL